MFIAVFTKPHSPAQDGVNDVDFTARLVSLMFAVRGRCQPASVARRPPPCAAECLSGALGVHDDGAQGKAGDRPGAEAPTALPHGARYAPTGTGGLQQVWRCAGPQGPRVPPVAEESHRRTPLQTPAVPRQVRAASVL
jgi:hypothetical protein